LTGSGNRHHVRSTLQSDARLYMYSYFGQRRRTGEVRPRISRRVPRSPAARSGARFQHPEPGLQAGPDGPVPGIGVNALELERIPRQVVQLFSAEKVYAFIHEYMQVFIEPGTRESSAAVTGAPGFSRLPLLHPLDDPPEIGYPRRAEVCRATAPEPIAGVIAEDPDRLHAMVREDDLRHLH